MDLRSPTPACFFPLTAGCRKRLVLWGAGWIITNYHVVEDDLDSLTVRFQDGSELPGLVERWDPVRDLALVQVDSVGLQPIQFATEASYIGDEVYAIGTPFEEGLEATVTRGILSAKRTKEGQKLLQTDVAISPGNSGGPAQRRR